ncbi:MAG: class I tRNA ligase family protein, partial [Pyrinomonadaceae bacterium]|nr:class I tRNA ligase family protein [Phycisphaerales bacterium]
LRSDAPQRIIDAIERAGFIQDSDVLDTWFSSGLWPLSTLGWPDPSKFPESKGMLEAFNPSTVLSTAREIITLWVSRMVMFNRYFTGGGTPVSTPGQVPFRNVFIHAVVQDGDGKRMSKSAGNGVDPLDIISSHGADALRFTLCQMTTQTQDVRLPVTRDPTTGKNTSPKFDVGRNFCNKLWNAARFALGMLNAPAASSASSPRSLDPLLPRSLSLTDRWMLSRLYNTIAEVNASLKDYQFAGYAQAMYDILWRDFCDWYLEAIKPTVAESAGQRAVLAHSLETIVRLLHPVTPFVTEALWEHLRTIETAPVAGFTLVPSRVNGLLATAGWPVLDASLRDEHAERDFARVQSLVNMIREVRAQHQVVTRRRITLHAPKTLLDELRVSGGLDYVESLAGLESAVDTSVAASAASLTATIRFESFDLVLSNLADKADSGAEKERLERELADRTKAVSLITKRLENPGYMAKAPAKLVEESKAQLAAFDAEIKVLTEQLEKMG